MSTYERYTYRFFTDKWVLLLVVWFFLVIKFKLLPNSITDVYVPFILCGIKMLWTKGSYIRVYSENIVYCHKELPTYLKKRLAASQIKRVYFKTLFFTMTDKDYCLIEYLDDKSRIKSLLINLERFMHPERAKQSLEAFCKRNNIETII